jgi:hypothetical protein
MLITGHARPGTILGIDVAADKNPTPQDHIKA